MSKYFIRRKETCYICQRNSRINPQCHVCRGTYEYWRNVPVKQIPSGKANVQGEIVLQELESVTKVNRPSDQQLVVNAVKNAVPNRGEFQKVRWAVVADNLAVGSATATLLCREVGLNPDEFLNGGFCGDCPYDPENKEG